jgi:hypothetical protein
VSQFEIMLKRLMMFLKLTLAIAVIVGAIAFVTYEEHKAGDKYQRDCQNRASEVSSAQDGNNAQGQDECQDSKKYMPWWYVLIAWPDGIAVWAVLATLGAIIWQSIETRRAAQASLLNAQALINAERPWLLVTVQEVPGPRGGFSVKATNKGRTPAIIASAHLGCVAVKDITDLPAIPPHGQGSMIQDHIVVPDDSPLVWWFEGETLKRILGSSFPLGPWENQVYVFGVVRYRDLLTPAGAVTHETRWISLYQPSDGEHGDSIIRLEGIGAPHFMMDIVSVANQIRTLPSTYSTLSFV